MTETAPLNARSADTLFQSASDQLQAHAAGYSVNPQVNSVQQLSYSVSSALLAGHLDLDQVTGLVRYIGNRAFQDRAKRLAAYHGSGVSGAVTELLQTSADAGFESFKAQIENIRSGIVFTAHPTFALSARHRTALVAAASGEPEEEISDPFLPDADVSLREEHSVMMGAIERARLALRGYNEKILAIAAERFPEEWKNLTPQLVTVASWVGYDLDGRTDIHWSQSISFKLAEKLYQLDHYAKQLQALGPEFSDLLEQIEGAQTLTRHQLEAFKGDLTDGDTLVTAANLLSEDHTGRLTDLTAIITALDERMANATDETSTAVLLLKSDMLTFGLGAARIHMRVNAAQVRGAVKADLNVDEGVEDFGRVALETAAKRAKDTKTLKINFANVFSEQMTARRQFMLCAQILKHIDSGTPIRFLIAECERPATVMGAVYLARLYGVAHKLDISPLFETPEALERGGRFMEQLIDEPAYLDYARIRGQLAIQIGYSDSGRFMGQIPAGMASERLQILVAKALSAKGACDISVLLFNTHGESMGRGANPCDFQARLNHLFTPWARSRFRHEGISVLHETSFQGGDGVAHFGNETLAQSSLGHILLHALEVPTPDKNDQFYEQISFSWDIYRGLKDWQEKLFADPDYRLSLSMLATQLLVKTGSRKSKRSAASDGDLSKVRAIPNNAALQQLGVPANVTGGLGTIVRKERERFLAMVAGSDRAHALLAYVAKARHLTSLPVLRAYASLYDAGSWVASAAVHGDINQKAMLELAEQLQDQTLYTALTRFSNHLASDLIHLDRVLAGSPVGSDTVKRHTDRIPLHILHAVRIALMRQAFVLIASLPNFSRRHDVSREDLIDMVLRLQLRDVVTVLSRVFPNTEPGAKLSGKLLEEAEDDTDYDHGYPEVHARIIQPLQQLTLLLEETSVVISQPYSAWG